ncbi:plasmid fertility inhibition factor family protein [Dendrosporobacter sp. 1207_IL3150]|uniref:plasmid fertility inhibition factor family protein n=1 Tax=Dendrosporobacter sp. 1207_IL3150 TaxID=3084054 RepID=UPI002FD96CD1
METFFKLAREPYSNSMNAIFRISTDADDVFMKVAKTPCLNDERFVVEVDSKRFLSLWRNTTDTNHIKIARGNILTWKQDRKYKDAVVGFSYGEGNPVPLAEVSCFLLDDKTAYINIANGVTRTIYLMSLGVSKFPIECSGIDQAKLLQNFAGLQNGKFKSVEELIPE